MAPRNDYLDELVISSRDEVWTVATGKVVDAVDTLFMALKCEIGHRGAHAPDLDGAVQGCASKCVGVLGVEHHLHHVVRVPLKYLRAHPSLWWEVWNGARGKHSTLVWGMQCW